jgi:organic hydroperoxide reductase OsmC/OhrA
MDLDLQGINQEQAFELIQEAHRVCPYSNATRGNIDIRIKHHGEQVI